MPVMLDPGIGMLIVVAIALLLVTASLNKWRDLARFETVVRAYRLIPEVMAGYAARAVPMLELTIGIMILLPAMRTMAALAGATLLLFYAFGISINLWRGHRDLDCGCGGPGERRPVAPWMVIRNVVLASALSSAAAPWALRVLTWTDTLTVIGGVVTLTLLYLAIDRLYAPAAPLAASMGSEP